MSENTPSTVPDPDAAPRPLIHLVEQPEAGGCCGNGSCGS